MNIQDELLSIKKELKCWESMFARKYGRKPTQEDVTNSSAEVKDSYKRYACLKKKQSSDLVSGTTALLEKSDVALVKKKFENPAEIDDGVFGKSLNKVSKPIRAEKIHHVKLETSSWRPKLNIKNKSLFMLNGDTERKQNACNVEEEKYVRFVEDADALSASSTKSAGQTTKLYGRRNSTVRRFHSWSQDMLDDCKKAIEESKENLPKKKEMAEANIALKTNTSMNCLHNKTVQLPGDTTTMLRETSKALIPSSLEKLCKDNQLTEFTERFSENRGEASQNSSGRRDKTLGGNLKHNNSKQESQMETKDLEKQEIIQNVDKESKEITTAEKENNTEKENGVGRNKGMNTVEITTQPATRSKRKRKSKELDEEGVKETSKKVKISKKAAEKGKRLVSNNFVKIDLRKKTYVRGIKKLTGAQYKRKMWKQKTRFDLPTKASLTKTCFRCGGDGHWAKFCKGKPKKVNPFSKLDEEKNSMEIEHLNETRGSCFDYLNNELNKQTQENKNSWFSKHDFTIEDVLDIKPCWPRTPYVSEFQHEFSEPLFPPENNKANQDAYTKVKSTLKLFGYEQFRDGQHEATARIVSGLSTLLILSTGAGKSLCYQLPAYLYYKERKAMTIVVSPLVALMQDQITSLPSCLPGAFLNSNMTKLQQQKVVQKIKDGQIAVLLVSPEALVSGGFSTGILPPKSSLPPISFACIDEAHCLSEWSHNFRPSYLKVCKVLRERYNINCLLGLTATASQTTAKSVTQHLGIPSDGSIIRDQNPIPNNLQLTASRDKNRDLALVELLQMSPFTDCDSIIVYVTRRTESDRLAALLRTSLPDRPRQKNKVPTSTQLKKKVVSKCKVKPHWWNVESYHAGLTPAQRRRVQNQFMSGELRVVVATVAFGMGLDKSDVRSVIHFNMPKSFENYVQEIGRAGRDGQPSFCHVFLDDDGNDLNELRRHVYGNTVDRTTLKRFVDFVFPKCNCNELAVQNEISNTNEDEITEDQSSQGEIDMFFDKSIDQIMEVKSIIGDSKLEGNEIIKTKNIKDFIELTDSRKLNLVHPVQHEEGEDPLLSIPYRKMRPEKTKQVYCSGHRVGLSIDSAVNILDMPEENISTLLSYLELHPRRWVEILNPIRSTCCIKCYGGPEQFQLLAKKFPPVALCIRQLSKNDLRVLQEMRQIDLDIIKIADLMCWDVLTVAREVRSLQWNMSFALDAPLNTTGKSGIIVECEQLSFHFVTSENITDDDRDEVCDFLHANVLKQERTRLLQLNALYNVLKDLSCKHYYELDTKTRVDTKARKEISKYFLYDEEGQLRVLEELSKVDTEIQTLPRRWNVLADDIRNLLISNPDQDFSGRSIAKIFQGIDSPCFPALLYGRDRRFWRQALDVDFNELRKFAVRELARFKC